MLRVVLMLLAGVLLGANLVYFAMTRDSGATASGAVSAPEARPVPTDHALDGSALDEPAETGLPVEPDRTATATEPVATAPRPWIEATPTPPGARPAATPDAPSATPLPPPPAPVAIATGTALAMPLPNLRPDQLEDTYDDPRGSSRQHEALDIMAPAGTPVLAVADGRVEKLFTSDQGGLTLYQFDPSGRYVYYYAHLLGYAAGLAEKQQVKRGQVLGYVGSTGNANPDAPHLHFAVSVLGPEKRWWQGTPINPYPLLGGRPGVPGVPPGQ